VKINRRSFVYCRNGEIFSPVTILTTGLHKEVDKRDLIHFLRTRASVGDGYSPSSTISFGFWRLCDLRALLWGCSPRTAKTFSCIKFKSFVPASRVRFLVVFWRFDCWWCHLQTWLQHLFTDCFCTDLEQRKNSFANACQNPANAMTALTSAPVPTRLDADSNFDTDKTLHFSQMRIY